MEDENEGKLDNGLLSDFMSTFYGYGNPAARLWFVGMEEGGGNELDEVRRRLCAWDVRGRRSFEDVAEYHREFDRFENFRDQKPKIQRTWRGLIHIKFAAEGRTPDRETVRAFQRDHWARPNGDICSTELLPLPSPGIGHWHYNKWSLLNSLASRATYETAWISRRIDGIRDAIARARPPMVIFYGQGYLPHWNKIAGCSLEPVGSLGFLAGDIGGTRYVAMRHPTAKSGVSDAYFAEIGRYASDQLQQDQQLAG